jgi:hypothetical protein
MSGDGNAPSPKTQQYGFSARFEKIRLAAAEVTPP